MKNLSSLIGTTSHNWTAPIPAQQMIKLAGLRGMYDEKRAIQAELKMATSSLEEADDETEEEKEAIRLVALLEEQLEYGNKAICAEEADIVEQGYHQVLQLRITLTEASGRTEAAYRSLMAEAGIAFLEETGHTFSERDAWPAEYKPQYNAIVEAYSSWARAMASLQGIEERTINALDYNPEDYGEGPGAWEAVDIPEDWRDPLVALDILPRTLLDRISTQALMSTRGTFDPRFFPAGARENGNADI